jgi:hypothetical protein
MGMVYAEIELINGRDLIKAEDGELPEERVRRIASRSDRGFRPNVLMASSFQRTRFSTLPYVSRDRPVNFVLLAPHPSPMRRSNAHVPPLCLSRLCGARARPG